METPEPAPSAPAAAPAARRSLLPLLLAGVGVALLGLCLVLALSLRRGPVDLAPLEEEAMEARQILGKSGRAEWAERAARDATERLKWARAWNEALEKGAASEVQEKAWTEYRRCAANAEKSLPEAREELRLLSGERW